MIWSRTKNQLIARAITRFPRLATLFIASYRPWESEGIPWAPFTKSLSTCSVAIVTTAGVHHRDQKPFNMIDSQGDPTYRVIDYARRPDSLMITHDYYDHKDADRDINIVFPVDRLREFAQEGIIGGLADRHYGFMGHIVGPHVLSLINRSAPDVARKLRQDGVDVVLLTPG
jgi:D-proline reductase (dithiol) PrdB